MFCQRSFQNLSAANKLARPFADFRFLFPQFHVRHFRQICRCLLAAHCVFNGFLYGSAIEPFHALYLCMFLTESNLDNVLAFTAPLVCLFF